MKRHFVVVAGLLALGAGGACSSTGGDSDSVGKAGAGSMVAGNGASGAGSGSSSQAGTTGSSAGSSAPSGAGSGGSSSAGSCVNRDMVNLDCPFNLPPITGSCAPAGECCHRASNMAKLGALGPDDPAVYEYRLNYVDVTNHPKTVGHPTLVMGAAARADICSGEQCLLWRFTAPRKGGQLVAGAGEVEIGIGAYNCDGTYSFYGPTAATDRTAKIGESDPARWASVKVPAQVDPSKQNVDRFHIPFASNRNREIARSIFVWPADNTIDWELASSGFMITQFDWSETAQDCVGKREGFGWSTTAGFESYSPLKGNEKDASKLISQTYCSLLAFGLLPEGKKNTDCLTTARCMPGTADCPWLKLPDSLCPETEAERALFGCHLGAEGNPNGDMEYPATLKCTPGAPTAALDPDKGATSDGQCCDPLGQSTTLPACNAYRTVAKFVAAAAEITDAPRNSLPPICM
jgi:hypothetical protein